MSRLLSQDRIDEYLTIVSVLSAVSLAGVFSVFVTNDLLVLAFTGTILLVVLYFLQRIDPLYLLYSLCFGVSFLPYINLNAFPLSGVYIVAFLLLLATAIDYIQSGRAFVISRQAKWMAGFLVLAVISLLWAPDKKQGIIYSGQFFVYLCIYVAAAGLLNEKYKIVRALKFVLLGVVFPLVLSFFQLLVSFGSLDSVINIFYHGFLGKLFIGTKGLERIGDDVINILNRGSNVAEASDLVLFRVFGTFEGPTSFGVYILLIALIAGGLYIAQWQKRRKVMTSLPNLIFLLLVTACLFLTWTRSAILAFMVGIVFLVIFRNSRQVDLLSRQNVIFVILIFVIPLLLLFFLTNIFSLRGIGGSTAARLLTIIFSVVYIYNNPIIGIGIGNYAYAQPGTKASAGEASLASAHNTFLELGVELGLPGIILFLCILFSFARQAGILMQAKRNSFLHTLGLIFLAFWIGFVISSFFGGSLIHPRLMTLLWLLAGIQTASYYQYLNERKKENTVYRLEVADQHADG